MCFYFEGLERLSGVIASASDSMNCRRWGKNLDDLVES